MINRDPKCVFVAANAAEASVVANWLEHEGVPAQVMDTMTLGGLDGLNPSSPTVDNSAGILS
jgi:hypothetical protein